MSGQAFHQRLTAAMQERGVTIVSLVDTCGAFSERTVTRWRVGHTVPGVEALPILARALGVSVGWLTGEGADAVPA